MPDAMRLLLLSAVLGLALVASPAVGTASAYVCGFGDVECHERQLRDCVVGDPPRSVGPQPCPP